MSSAMLTDGWICEVGGASMLTDGWICSGAEAIARACVDVLARAQREIVLTSSPFYASQLTAEALTALHVGALPISGIAVLADALRELAVTGLSTAQASMYAAALKLIDVQGLSQKQAQIVANAVLESMVVTAIDTEENISADPEIVPTLTTREICK